MGSYSAFVGCHFCAYVFWLIVRLADLARCAAARREWIQLGWLRTLGIAFSVEC